MKRPGVRSLVALSIPALVVVTAFLFGGVQAHATRATGGCPRALLASDSAVTNLVRVARRSQPTAEVVGVLSLSPFSLGTDDLWRNIARAKCGRAVASRSWVAFYYRPQWAKRSASIAEGVSYFTLTRSGWRLWYRYR